MARRHPYHHALLVASVWCRDRKAFSYFIQSWIAAPENREIEAVGALRSFKQKPSQSVQDLERKIKRLEGDLTYVPLERQKFMDFYHVFRTDIALGIRSELKDCFTRAEVVMAAQRVEGYLVTRSKTGEKRKKKGEPQANSTGNANSSNKKKKKNPKGSFISNKTRGSQGDITCYICNELGHISPDYPMKGEKDKPFKLSLKIKNSNGQ
jgi:hypothetical protein